LIKRTLLFAPLVLAGLLAFAAPALAADQEGGLWLPWSASDYAEEIDFIYKVIFWVTTGMFLLTEGLLIGFCIVYRRRPGHRPQYTHGNHTAEIAWTVIPALILLGIAVWQIPIWNRIKLRFPKPTDEKVTTVDVIGEQYKWHFRYPGSKAKYKGEDDVKSTGVIRVPMGDTILCNLRSKDVIHSFFIPHMRVKQDAVPGLRQRIWFKPNRIKLVEVNKADGTPVETKADPDGYQKPDRTPRQLQPVRWITDEAEIVKPSEDPNALYNQKIALSDYAEVDGRYGVILLKATG
jgi:cytochrome c oxidase subunit 2